MVSQQLPHSIFTKFRELNYRKSCWTWPGSAPKPPGTFSGTLLNLTWLCTKASRNLLRNLLQNLLRNLLRTPIEPNLALHQSLPHLLRNLLRNPVEPDLALRQSLPDLLRNLRNLLRNLVELAHRSYSGLKTPLAYAVGEKHARSSQADGTFWNLTQKHSRAGGWAAWIRLH